MKHSLDKRILFVFLLCFFCLNACSQKTVSFKEKGYEHPVVKTGRSLIGVPYKWGGSSPETGMDCSGYLVWVFKQHGYTIPRVTKDQAKAGKAVGKGTEKSGDILIFRLGKRSLHTALYAGRGRFLHSPKAGARVREDNFHDEFWQLRYMGARRVLKE